MFVVVHVVSLYFVTASIRLKIREAKIGTSNSKWFDLTRLKDQGVREEFNITLRNRYSTLQDETAITIDQFHQVMNDAATEVIGYERPTKLELLSIDTWIVIEERKQLKLLDAKSPELKDKAAALYRENDKEVRKSARRDKRFYTDQFAEKAQKTAEIKKLMKTVY